MDPQTHAAFGNVSKLWTKVISSLCKVSGGSPVQIACCPRSFLTEAGHKASAKQRNMWTACRRGTKAVTIRRDVFISTFGAVTHLNVSKCQVLKNRIQAKEANICCFAEKKCRCEILTILSNLMHSMTPRLTSMCAWFCTWLKNHIRISKYQNDSDAEETTANIEWWWTVWNSWKNKCSDKQTLHQPTKWPVKYRGSWGAHGKRCPKAEWDVCVSMSP